MDGTSGSRLTTLALALVVLAFPSASMDGADPPEPAGIAWTVEIADDMGGTGSFNSVALAPDGSPGIGYNAGRDLRYAWRDPGGWRNVTVDQPASGTAGYHTSLAIDGRGVPHIGYMLWNSSGQHIRYAYWNETLLTWVRELAGDAGEGLTRMRLSLALDSSETPHIAYVHTETGTLTYASRVGPGTWIPEDVATVGCCRAVSLKIDSQDIPHLAAYNYTLPGLEYYRKNGASWLRETVETTSMIGDNGISLALNGSDRPRIAYVVVNPGPQLKFANRTATIWSLRTVPTTVHADSYVSLGLDSTDQPRIAYADSTAGFVLKYSFRQAGLWQTVVVDTDDVWVYVSLAYDPSGAAHIAYLGKRSTVGNLKYAKGTTFNDLPTSSVQAVAPYWRTVGPLPVQSMASDPDGAAARVDLFYRFDGGGGWGPWTWHGSDPMMPWAWSFPFPDGEGRYEFHSLAFDGTDWEANKTVAEASAGYDATPPASFALPMVTYWHNAPPATVNASASDALSGVAEVTLSYAYSPNNTTFGPWVAFGTLAAPPWSWTFPFPDGEGYYQFYTMAADIAGNVEAGKTAAEAEAAYRRPDSPPMAVANASAAIASMSEPITFDATGSADDHGIVAYWWDFGDGATDPNPTAVHAYASRGTFLITLTVWDTAGQNDTDSLTIDVQNRQPIAGAGPDQTADKYVTARLDGTGSNDPDGDTLAYAWSQLAGPLVSLVGADTTMPTFIPTMSGTYTFRLSVNDSWGGLSSDAVNVTVGNRPPIAYAGPNRAALKGAAVTLEGSASYDPDGDSLTYAWTQESGPPVVLSNPDAAAATFAPVRAGTYAFRLRVVDTESAAAEDTVAITVPNAPPVASFVASPTTVRIGRPVAFDAAGSADPDGTIVGYAFDFGDGARGNGTAATASHAYAVVGAYTVTLTVTDDEGAMNVTEATVTVVPNEVPSAEPNRKPFVAAALAAVLAFAGAWSARRAPWTTGSHRRLRAFAFTALPFVLLEAATGVLSQLTGLLAIPPLPGIGSAVDLSILVAGVVSSLYRVRRWMPPS